MNYEQARRRLPEAHDEILLLRDQGLSHEAIADRLGIPPRAVPPLIQVAEAKLARLVAEASPTASTDHEQETADTT